VESKKKGIARHGLEQGAEENLAFKVGKSFLTCSTLVTYNVCVLLPRQWMLQTWKTLYIHSYPLLSLSYATALLHSHSHSHSLLCSALRNENGESKVVSSRGSVQDEEDEDSR